jgi:hypothetical protein
VFFIVNNMKCQVEIEDIHIKLGPRQALDLDKKIDREKSENSKDLRFKVGKGIISIRAKDNPVKVKFKQTVDNTNDINKLKEDLINEMKSQLQAVGQDLKNQLSNNKKELSIDDIKEVMKQIVSEMPQASNTVIMQEVKKKISEEQEIEVDESLLADIHARTVNELTKETSVGNVNYKEEKQKNTILNNVDELSDLLG